MIKNNRLKVNALYYSNFSRWLRTEVLKFRNVEVVSYAILRKLEQRKLTSKDIEILISFEHVGILRALFTNLSVPRKLKYKMLIKKRLYNQPYFAKKCALCYKDNQSKIRDSILNHYEKYYLENNKDSWNTRIFNELYTDSKDIPLCLCTKLIAVLSLIDNTYSRNSVFQYEVILQRMSSEDIERYIQLALYNNIALVDITSLLESFNKYIPNKNTRFTSLGRFDILKVIKEVLKNSTFSISSSYYNSDVLGFVSAVLELKKTQSISSTDAEDMLKLLKVDKEDNKCSPLLYLLQLIKKGG